MPYFVPPKTELMTPAPKKFYPIMGTVACTSAAYMDVFGGSADYPVNAGAVALKIRGTSALDAAAGTGCRSIRITYISASGHLEYIDHPTPGAAVVPIGTFTAKSILNITPISFGSAGKVQGLITIERNSDSAHMGVLGVGEFCSDGSLFQVPVGYECLISDIHFGLSSSGLISIGEIMFVADVDIDFNLQQGVFRSLKGLVSANDCINCTITERFPEGATIKYIVRRLSGGNPVQAFTHYRPVLVQKW